MRRYLKKVERKNDIYQIHKNIIQDTISLFNTMGYYILALQDDSILNFMESGIYLLIFRNNDSIMTQKIIKTK